MSTGTRGREGSGRVEFAHFWQEGGGKRMVAELFDDFRRRNPGVELDEEANSIDDHGMFVKSRILREDPPDVFAEWPGSNLEPYTEAGALADLSTLWDEQGWESVFIEGPRERARIDGAYYGVPLDIHRMNNVFYDVGLAERFGVDVAGADDPREFLEVLRACENDGDVIGMEQPMKNPSDVLQLFANVIIGQYGAETYAGITRGRTADYRDEIHSAVALLDEYADLAREDAAFLGMVEASDRFAEGRSVCFHQGDWMAGAYEAVDGFDYGRDWDRVNFPGTDGVFMLASDAAVAADTGGIDPAARDFLAFLGSTGAQETLNRIKGSIPPREDVSLDAYPRILREQYEDFKRARHFPAGHALQVDPETFTEVKLAAGNFLVSRDVDRATREFVEAYS